MAGIHFLIWGAVPATVLCCLIELKIMARKAEATAFVVPPHPTDTGTILASPGMSVWIPWSTVAGVEKSVFPFSVQLRLRGSGYLRQCLLHHRAFSSRRLRADFLAVARHAAEGAQTSSIHEDMDTSRLITAAQEASTLIGSLPSWQPGIWVSTIVLLAFVTLEAVMLCAAPAAVAARHRGASISDSVFRAVSFGASVINRKMAKSLVTTLPGIHVPHHKSLPKPIITIHWLPTPSSADKVNFMQKKGRR